MVANEPVDVGLNGIPFYFFRDVEGKGVDKKGPGCGFADPTGAKIEQGIFTELSHGGTVTALHVVGIDLQLGLGINGRFFADDEVVILLKGVRLLRVLVYKDLAVEDTGGLLEQHALVELVAKTKRLLVVDEGMVIDQLLAGGEVEAVQMCFRMVFLQLCLQVVADQVGTGQRKCIIVIKALFFLPYCRVVDDPGAGAGALNKGMAQFGVGV